MDLWIMLHGTFAIFEYDDWIEVRIPNLGSECAYRAGDWLAETTIEAGTTHVLSIPGAPGSRRFDGGQNILIQGGRPTNAGFSRLYATLLFPAPDDIQSFAKALTGMTGKHSPVAS